MNNCYIKQKCFGYPDGGRRLIKTEGWLNGYSYKHHWLRGMACEMAV